MNKTLLKLLPLGILLIGGGLAFLLIASREAPTRRQLPYEGPLVEGIAAPPQTLQVTVDGQGTVRPAAQIDLVPQVPGIVVWKSTQLEAGGFFARGDLLLRIDPRDYELAVTRAEAGVARALYQLDLAREEAAVARQEWEMLQVQQDTQRQANALVLKLPQVRAAEADLQAAEASLAEARLRLSRTRIRAPFDGRVRAADIDAGQYVNANQPVARIYSIEKAEIVVPVPDEDMAWFDLPSPLASDPMATATAQAGGADAVVSASERPAAALPPPPEAPKARVSADYAGRPHQWEGRVVRSEAELDPRSRMMRLVVEVDRPYAAPGDDRAPLLVGMFVDVEILGTQVDDVRVLPRLALRQGDVVWVADAQGRLRVRPAQVVKVRQEEVLVRLELAPEERVIVSQLNGVTDGMKVRLTDAEAQL